MVTVKHTQPKAVPKAARGSAALLAVLPLKGLYDEPALAGEEFS